jgi:hypothetical protein
MTIWCQGSSINDLLGMVPKAKYLSLPFAGHEVHKDQTGADDRDEAVPEAESYRNSPFFA